MYKLADDICPAVETETLCRKLLLPPHGWAKPHTTRLHDSPTCCLTSLDFLSEPDVGEAEVRYDESDSGKEDRQPVVAFQVKTLYLFCGGPNGNRSGGHGWGKFQKLIF